MDKRYQVFVSSTYDDLQEERQEVMHALLELDCMPSGMELFPAANESQWSLIKRVIDDCDYYILILAGRYGSVGSDGISYTEMEYQYAESQAKAVIAFLHKDPGSIPTNKSEATEEGKSKLASFRKQVEQKLCKYWTIPTELGSVLGKARIANCFEVDRFSTSFRSTDYPPPLGNEFLSFPKMVFADYTGSMIEYVTIILNLLVEPAQ